MNPAIFRKYDIRGKADRDLTDDFARSLGRALATMLQRDRARVSTGESGATSRPTCAVGRDCRLTSPRIHAAFVDGIAQTGVDVLDVGVVPTPVLYFATHHFATSGGAMITGSHNPPEENGFKVLRGTATLYGEDIQALRSTIERRDFHEPDERGTAVERDATGPYLDYAAGHLQLGARRTRVAVDAGNGAGGPTAVALYERLGFDVIPVYCEMDGSFPNHHPDPIVAANLADLRARVASEGAEIGIALDGDADRLGVIDGEGRVIWGDQLMILLGRAILEEHPGALLIGEVKCSQAMFDELEKAGGKPIMWKVGHSLIKARMKEVGALFGGEMSGHLFFADRYLGFDDAIYSGARVLEMLSRGDLTLAALRDTLPQMVNTPEIRIECADDIKFGVVRRATARLRARADVVSVVDVDGARAIFADGWGLVRASNTQPALVVRCEAASEERLRAIQSAVEAEIAAARDES
jgi:phosphomannomutase/phosphoglucomutase